MNKNEFYFDERLLEPLNYLIRIPGKKIRTKLIQVKNNLDLLYLPLPVKKIRNLICDLYL